MNIQNRLKSIRKLMVGMDAVLATTAENIYYYSGYLSPEPGALIIYRNSKPVLFVSPLENDFKKLPGINVEYFPKDGISKHFKGLTVGYDENSLTARKFLMLKKESAKVKPAGEALRKPREVKELWEVTQMKKAIKITKQILAEAKPCGTEENTAFWIDSRMRQLGAANSFSTIVAAGKQGGFIHHRPNNYKIGNGDFVTIDMGVKVNGYCSDLTRTLDSLETRHSLHPSGFMKKIKDDCLEIQAQVIDFIGVGVKFKEIQDYYVKLMEKKKYKVYHLFGHSIGLEVHETIDEIRNGAVVTVEPGIYFPGKGGCRIEDMVLIKNGKAKVL